MTIKFEKKEKELLLIYEPSSYRSTDDWIDKKFEEGEEVSLRKTFYLSKKHLLVDTVKEEEDSFYANESYRFIIGKIASDGYYRIDRDVLAIKYDLYMHKNISLRCQDFVSVENISIFGMLNELSINTFHLGGESPNSFPEDRFREMLKVFPNTYELHKYALARLAVLTREYVEPERDREKEYLDYMKKKSQIKRSVLSERFNEAEREKYNILLNKLKSMLDAEMGAYTEGHWQEEIRHFILLLYPKYVQVLEKLSVNNRNGNRREIDIAMIDSDGNLDIVEIKKPFDDCAITKKKYRNNHVPHRELSGTIMQVEKYIYYLSKGGATLEERLNKKYKNVLLEGLDIKITNPRGIIIAGRSFGLSDEQKEDFEIVKRKYKNIIDIITYDDLLNRLSLVLKKFS